MNDTQNSAPSVLSQQTVVASYSIYAEAEEAVRRLSGSGVPLSQISMIGRDFEAHKGIQGFYHPPRHPLDGLERGAWVGGIFGLLVGATGFFVMPVVGVLMVLGPLSEMIAGAIAGAGVGAGIGALTQGLLASGIPEEQALRYQDRLQSGEFLVVVHGSEAMQACKILEDTAHSHLQAHCKGTKDSAAFETTFGI
ncbi:MAG: general stress protein [Janthinobacterium lividum]